MNVFFMVICDGIEFFSFLSTKYALWSVSCMLTFDYTYFKALYEVFLPLEDDQMLEEIGLMGDVKCDLPSSHH